MSLPSASAFASSISRCVCRANICSSVVALAAALVASICLATLSSNAFLSSSLMRLSLSDISWSMASFFSFSARNASTVPALKRASVNVFSSSKIFSFVSARSFCCSVSWVTKASFSICAKRSRAFFASSSAFFAASAALSAPSLRLASRASFTFCSASDAMPLYFLIIQLL